MSATKAIRDINGKLISAARIDELFEQAEAGILPGRPGPVRMGRPLSVGHQPAGTRTVRLTAEMDADLVARAEREHVTPSHVMREALAAYLVPA
ncbi:MAG: ribbon-helix-helix domain-containing protein [Cellulomonadaceae bacterium]|jgi:predicted transcriptional regulator|nr:ribbon-helix-helix domain-containing protein [Cellulomonadaceae bacterium]